MDPYIYKKKIDEMCKQDKKYTSCYIYMDQVNYDFLSRVEILVNACK